ncbi:MAG: DUF4347 domain-containing protein [Burkholderiaceae bacterium]
MALMRQRSSRPKRRRRRGDGARLRVETLEPRILFSAELATLTPNDLDPESPPIALTSLNITDADAQQPTHQTLLQNPTKRARELIIVDERVPQAEALIETLRNGQAGREFDVLLIAEDRSGLAQIADYVDGHEAWSAWHVFSHASPGALQLGADTVSMDSLSEVSTQIAAWAPAISEDGDILLYGCDLAATDDGLALIDALAGLSGADVAASIDTTGESALGGDFDLEVRTGAIETEIALDAHARSGFTGTLATYTVTTTNDDGPGSLRQAINDANTNPGADTIEFSISDPLVGGLHTIAVVGPPNFALPAITDTVMIDGSSEPDFVDSPVIRITGPGSLTGLALGAGSDGSTIRGLIIENFVDGIVISDSTGNVIGGATSAERNIISGNSNDAIRIDGESADGNAIQANWIGVSADGSTSIGNGGAGISVVNGSDANAIGGPGEAGNWIAGAGLSGIEIDGISSGNLIQGNRIGTDLAGSANWGSQQDGILLTNGAFDNLVGGALAGEGNEIAFSGQGGTFTDGIEVAPTAGNGNAVLGNILHDNLGQGIELDADGVLGNDAADADSGPNDLQNMPTLVSADELGADLRITGSINTLPNTDLRIEFFATPAGSEDASGHGEAHSLLGSVAVSTDAAGDAVFDVLLTNQAQAPGTWITATATLDPGGGNYGSTSELALNQAVTANDAPTLTIGLLSASTEGAGVVILDAGAVVADPDSPNFAGAQLTVAVTGNGTPADRLTVVHQGSGAGEVGVSGSDISYGGMTVAAMSGGTDGATALVVDFNASADLAAVQAVLRRIGHQVIGEDPSTLNRTLSFTLSDGDGGTSATVNRSLVVDADADIWVTGTSDSVDGNVSSIKAPCRPIPALTAG